MSTRENQAYNDGRLAFRDKVPVEKNPRRGVAQRAAWMRGFEHERRLELAEKITPAERAEAVSVAGRLGDWARQMREAKP